jgi:hypothetical protein
VESSSISYNNSETTLKTDFLTNCDSGFGFLLLKCFRVFPPLEFEFREAVGVLKKQIWSKYENSENPLQKSIYSRLIDTESSLVLHSLSWSRNEQALTLALLIFGVIRKLIDCSSKRRFSSSIFSVLCFNVGNVLLEDFKTHLVFFPMVVSSEQCLRFEKMKVAQEKANRLIIPHLEVCPLFFNSQSIRA